MLNYDALYALSGLVDDRDYQLDIDADYDTQVAVGRGVIPGFDDRPPKSRWRDVGYGSEPDIARTTVLVGMVLSEHAVGELQGVTGWQPVPILGPRCQNSDLGNKKYSLMSITGRAGPVDPTRSKIEIDPDSGDADLVGLYFLDDDWDGSDIFVLKERNFTIFVTELAKRTLEGICGQQSGRLEFTSLSSYRLHPLGMQSIVENQIKDGLTTTEWKWGSF